jgi:hypothetical protein
MNERRAFDRGMAAGILLMMGVHAAHWFIAGHPEAGSLRTYLVVLQLVSGLGGAVWMIVRRPRGAESIVASRP